MNPAPLFLIMGFISLGKADVMPIDQAISQAASEVRDAGLLWDDSSILVELDMRFTHEQWQAIQESRGDYGQRRHKRKAYRPVVTRWDNAEVPYSISTGFSYQGRKVIKQAMEEWQRVTCVTFRETTRNEPSVTFIPTGGCSSNIGKSGRPGQSLTLGRGCQYKGVVIHELGHALGFFHEQSRPDRDNFITIHTRNIVSNMKYNFDKYPSSTINTFSIPYDYKSIMHYGPYYFSKNGQKTITARRESDTKLLGNRYGLTYNDIHLANRMYECAKRRGCNTRKYCGRGFLGKDCRCWCEGPSIQKPVVYCDDGEAITDISTGIKPTLKPTTTAPPEDLYDLHPGCRKWAASGFCSYDRYTIDNCKKSCSIYSRKRTTTPRPDGDQHPLCSYWASYGECDRNPGYMLVYCKKSCNRFVPKCVDTMPRMCRVFRRECNSRSLQQIMKKFCSKTCNSCTRQQRIASCQDLAPRTCSLFAVVGKCIDKDPKIKKNMQLTCPKACGLCNQPADESCPSGNCDGRSGRAFKDKNCYDRFPICPKWSSSRRCTWPLLRDTMKIFCRRSCNLC